MLEICAFHLEDCYDAVRAGAERLEICQDYEAGGIGPPKEWIFALKHSVHVPLVAMIRPRPGNFCYSKEEWQTMHERAIEYKNAGAHSLVFGGLSRKNRLDIPSSSNLIQSIGLPCVLHRAFDSLEDPFQGVEDAISAGFIRILTGWGSKDLHTLHALKNLAGSRIEILPGGGIRSSNVSPYLKLGFKQIHSSGITGPSLRMNSSEVLGLSQAMKSSM